MRVQELDFAFEDSLKPLWSSSSAVFPARDLVMYKYIYVYICMRVVFKFTDEIQ